MMVQKDDLVLKIKESKRHRPIDDDTQSESGVLDKDVADCKLIIYFYRNIIYSHF